MRIKIQPKQHHESKMTPEELQEHLKMCRNGASATKNGKRYIRKPKHDKRLSYCWDFFFYTKKPHKSEVFYQCQQQKRTLKIKVPFWF